jgi:ribosomal protein L40E
MASRCHSRDAGDVLLDRARTPRSAPTGSARSPHLPTCLRCGLESNRAEATFCRRCGLPYGAPPPENVDLPICPICYAEPGPDGRFASQALPGLRIGMPEHRREHERFPVGDDDWLESLREGDRVRVGRWLAPFDQVRKYLVTGAVEGGGIRRLQHDAITTAMTQIKRWGPNAEIMGDQAEWREARAVLSALMERYHRGGLVPNR